MNKNDFADDKWIVDKCGNLYEIREKIIDGSILLATIHDPTKKGLAEARLISYTPKMRNALIDDIGIFEDMKDLDIKNTEFWDKIISYKIDLIEKATGKKWEDIK